LGIATQQTVPSVGAFPLTPEGGPDQVGAVRSLLKAAFDLMAKGAKYAEERAFFEENP
jgi:hypothetical protein